MASKVAIINKPYSWVFFDLDGTLADSIHSLYQVYLSFMKDYGIAGNENEFEELNGFSLSEIIAFLVARHHLVGNIKDFFKIYKSKILFAYQNEVAPFGQAELVLKELCARGFQLMLVTSTEEDVALRFIQKQGWNKYFASYVFGNEVDKAKPAPDIYKLALNRASLTADEVVVIEDSLNGVRSAKAAQTLVIAVEHENSRHDLLAVGADDTVTELMALVKVINAN